MLTIVLAITLFVQLQAPTETSSLKCFDLGDDQKACIEVEGNTSVLPTDEFLIQEVRIAPIDI